MNGVQHNLDKEYFLTIWVYLSNSRNAILFPPNGDRFVDYVAVVEQRDPQKQRAILAEDARDRASLRPS